jgi:hypothetical protein
MNNFNPMNYNFNPKIKSDYVFEDSREMNKFLRKAKYNPNILTMNQSTKNNIVVEFRDENTKASYDEAYEDVTPTRTGAKRSRAGETEADRNWAQKYKPDAKAAERKKKELARKRENLAKERQKID